MGVSFQGRVIGLTWATAGLFLVALVVATASLLRSGEADAIAHADERIRQVVAGAEADLNRTLMGADLVLAALPEVLKAAIGPGDVVNVDEAHRILSALNDRQLIFADVALLDTDGATLAAGLPASHRGGLALPAGLLDGALARGGVASLVLSDAVVGAYSGERSVVLARRVRLPGGRSLVAAAELPLALLTSVASTALTTAGLTVTLEREDGRLVMSLPADDARIGQRQPPLSALDASGQPRAAAARLGGSPARVAARPTLYPGLLIAVSVPLDGALAEHRRDARVIVAVAALFGLLVLGTAGLAHWQLLRLGQARQALDLSMATLDQALASMGDAFLLCDAQDRVVRWNQRYLQTFPWLQPVLRVGVPFHDLAVAAAQWLCADDPVQRQAWIEMRVGLHVAADRGWQEVLVTGVAVNAVERRTPDGGIVSVYRDISAAERQLARAKAEAEAANDAKSQFLANMSHEIRTPLNAVLGLNDLLLLSTLDTQQRRYAELVRSSGQLLLSLINDILDLARIEAGHADLQAQPFSPQRVVQEVLALMDERARAQQLPLTLTVSPAVSPELLGDGVRVRQVLFNLVGNALKFTVSGAVRVALDQHPCPDGSGDVMLQVQVTDTGIGIAPEALPTLFERFTQGDASAARRHGGSGLGLAITREVVQLMGGQIGVTSRPGQGSCFTATMRCAKVPVAGGPRPADAQAEAADVEAGLRVLVAEDNAVNQLVIEATLQRMGHHVQVVGDGRQALELVQSADCDLVLMDMQMPELDGAAATRAIRALGGAVGRLPIVAMTANAREEDRQACLDAGMDDYVSKPVDHALLQAVMARAMKRGRAREAALGARTAVD
ncbi:MAG: hypothetical protein RJA10_2239 [Pseudomonadota bacterium]|jgi:signal transduction histidine kinase/CheY-like chemotaxis protein